MGVERHPADQMNREQKGGSMFSYCSFGFLFEPPRVSFTKQRHALRLIGLT